MKRKGFTLVELMVVVAIIAILAAVAIPMYTRFKMKAVASGPTKVTGGLTSAFQAHFDEFNSFVSVDTQGPYTVNSPITYTHPVTTQTANLGATLPALEDVEWTVTGGAIDRVIINWTFTTGVRCNNCNGTYCIICTDDGCSYVIDLINDELGLDKFTDATNTSC